MPAQVQWHGAEFEEWYKALVAARLERAARHVHNRVKEKLNLSGVGGAAYAHNRQEIVGQTKDGKLLFATVHYKKRQRIYGFVRSQPGEPPRKQYGTLRRGVTYEVDKGMLVARVGLYGPALAYAKFLELGTRKMKARPYLRQTLFEESGNIEAILAGKGVQNLAPGPGEGVNLPGP